ncbi:MAG: GDSL-type esterase/lipase family protein [Bacteroidales bacterium]|nr:GDSL-type esterase/lipase family protein [Bacteroidales bacterium]
MKIKKIVFIVALVFLVILIVSSCWFVSRIQVYGDIKVSFQSTLLSEDAKIVAYTPMGREVIFSFDKNDAFIEGFYNQIYVVLPRKIDVSDITIEKNGARKIYQIDTSEYENNIVFSIPPKSLKNNTFLNKTFSFIGWFFSISLIQDVLFFLLLAIPLFIGLLLNRRQIKSNRTEDVRDNRKFLKIISIFVASLLFWTIVIFFFIEIFLRIFGFFYSDESRLFYHSENDRRYTILCIGDSYTYGIGAIPDKSYPHQLKSIIEQNYGIDASVINAGVCAGNTTQMLENIQDLLLKHNPDVVVMLFGMANSWNYYGYSASDSFLYRIRTYKLVKRIIQNIEYKKNGFEMWQKADDFKNQIRNTVIRHFVQKKSLFDITYYAGRYFLANRNWNFALANFAIAASQNSMNDSVFNALSVCVNKIDEDYFYSGIEGGHINKTVVDKTLRTIDFLILKYPDYPDFLILKYRYYIAKLDSTNALSVFQKMAQKFRIPEHVFFDLEKIMDENTLAKYYRDEAIVTTSFFNSKAFYYLKRNLPLKAEECFEKGLILQPDNYYSQLGIAIIESAKFHKSSPLFVFKKDILSEICQDIYEIIYSGDSLDFSHSKEKDVKYYFESMGFLKNGNSNYISNDSLFLLSCSKIITEYYFLKENQHEDFFLVHKKKRSMNVKEKEIFRWIEKDISAIIDICVRQGFPVICMNYPLTPPPNSEEISFWAANVGEIWKKTADYKKLPFINNDSIFSLYGDRKSELFEPVHTGSQHCNETGYKQMATNIYKCLLRNNLLNQQTHK